MPKDYSIVQAEFDSFDKCKEECKKDIGPVIKMLKDAGSDRHLLRKIMAGEEVNSYMVRWYIVLVLSTTL